MRRQFIAGAAVTFVLLLTGLKMEIRFPDRAGPGAEVVEFHGVNVFRREIAPADVPLLSPLPSLMAMTGTMVVGSMFGGGMVVLLEWIWNGKQPTELRKEAGLHSEQSIK